MPVARGARGSCVELRKWWVQRRQQRGRVVKAEGKAEEYGCAVARIAVARTIMLEERGKRRWVFGVPSDGVITQETTLTGRDPGTPDYIEVGLDDDSADWDGMPHWPLKGTRWRH